MPAIARWAATRTYEFTDAGGTRKRLTNHNKFLPDNGFGYRGANGFKTGFTQQAGHTLVATANRDGRELIVVILGAVDSGYTWAASLLEAGFATAANTKGTGIRLPAVAVSPYGTRVAQRDGVRPAQRNGAGIATPDTNGAFGSRWPRRAQTARTTRQLTTNQAGGQDTAAGC